MDPEKIKTIKKLAEPIVEQEDLYLVDVEEKGGSETVLWIYIDSLESDVSVEACSKISRELGFVLDAHEVIASRYRLNVSSPGIGMLLTDPRQFKKNRGRTARVKFKSPQGYEKIEGIVNSVNKTMVEIVVSGEQSRSIEIDSIVEAKIIPKI